MQALFYQPVCVMRFLWIFLPNSHVVWDGLEQSTYVHPEVIDPSISPVLSVKWMLDLLVGTI